MTCYCNDKTGYQCSSCKELDEAQAEIARLKARADQWKAIAVGLGDQVESAMRGKFHSESGADALANLQAMTGEME